MKLNHMTYSFGPLWAPEGVAAGGGAETKPEGEGADKTPESILFPADPDKPAGDKTPEQIAADAEAAAAADKAKLEGDKPKDDDKPADWKEYVPDPAKTDDENAAAKAEHDKTKPADAAAADKVPEDGKYVLTMPEGIEVDQDLVDALGPEFKDMKLTTAQAQRLADKFIEIQQGRATKQGETWANRVSGWADEAKADKDIGGDKWDATVSAATRAVNTFGSPGLKDYLNASGGGNHKEVIAFMAKVGAMIKEDAPPSGGSEGNGKPVEAAHTLFPNDAPKGN